MSKPSRVCKKCGNLIPHAIYINGEAKSLMNRKFCTTCSPYKIRKFKAGESVKQNDKVAKKPANCLQIGTDRKQKLLEMAGGGCSNCGYNRCMRAICFHHRNPESKSFGLSMNNLRTKTWDEIMEEFSKCDVLCVNCHAEVEANIAKSRPTHYQNLLGI